MITLLPLTLSWMVGAALLLADGRRRWVAGLAVATLLVVTGSDLWLLLRLSTDTIGAFETTTGDWPAGVGIRLYVDGLSLFFAAVCAAVLAAVMYHEMGAGPGSRLLPALLLLMCAGLHGAFFTGDLFNFYVFFELAVVTSFVLATYGHGRAESRGAFIYMVLNLLGSVLFLVGVAAVYHAMGTLDFELLAANPEAREEAALLPGALLLTALALKLGLFPFHGWVPVVYSHARAPVAAALAGALVNIAAYGLLRIGLTVFGEAAETARWLLLAMGATATLYGALLALERRTAAELAAYLAIAQTGYVMLGFGLGSHAAVAAVLLVVLTGSLEKTVMFLAIDVHGRIRRWSAAVAAVSAAGLPLTLGFIAKVQLFHAGLTAPARGVALAALLLATPLLIAAALRFWRLAGAIELPATAPRWPAASLMLPAASIALGLAPESVAALAGRISSALLEIPP